MAAAKHCWASQQCHPLRCNALDIASPRDRSEQWLPNAYFRGRRRSQIATPQRPYSTGVRVPSLPAVPQIYKISQTRCAESRLKLPQFVNIAVVSREFPGIQATRDRQRSEDRISRVVHLKPEQPPLPT